MWIARLDIPHGIEAKIKSKHDLTAEDVLNRVTWDEIDEQKTFY